MAELKNIRITISKELHKKIKATANNRDLKMYELLNEVLENYFNLKHSTPANNGNLHSSLDEACKEEIKD